jgi:hypothetical protein
MSKIAPNVPDIHHDKNGKLLSFEGNRLIKPAHAQLEYTAEHIIELEKCRDDIVYFAENYFHIVNLDEGLIKIKLRDYQIELLHNFQANRFNIVLASRQSGKSTVYEVYLTHYILFNDYKSAALLANKAKTAYGLMARVRKAYENLPKWLQQGVVSWNAGTLELENGSQLTCDSTSSSAARSMSINLLVLDELAFVPKNVWDEFYSSVYPTISSSKTSQIIMVSTPKGKNHFYKFWEEANRPDDDEAANSFVPVRVDWWQVPDRDEKWEKMTRRNIGDKKFEQEFNNSFIGSSNTLISMTALERMVFQRRIPDLFIYEQMPNHRDKLQIYHEPVKGRLYSLGVDTSKLSEEISGDAISIQVLDITTVPFKQVAHFYADEDFSYLETPEIAWLLGNYYNGAYAFIENNEIGQQIADALFMDYEYENVFFEKGRLPGFRTTKKTKRIGCTNMRAFLENNKLEINDFETISQLSTFVKVNKTYKADDGYDDDAVLGLMASLFFLQSPQYNHLDDRKKFLAALFDRKEAMDGELKGKDPVEEEVMPFGYTGNDLDDPDMKVF